MVIGDTNDADGFCGGVYFEVKGDGWWLNQWLHEEVWSWMRQYDTNSIVCMLNVLLGTRLEEVAMANPSSPQQQVLTEGKG